MKKILLLGLIGLMGLVCNTSRAQFSDYGVRGSLGIATISDNLTTKSPILGVGVGGYINYTFAKSKSVLAEIFYLQTGLNIVRRGRNFEEVLEQNNNLHYCEGYCKAWYIQLPILAGVHMELPVRQEGHIVGVFLGPAISFGLFGSYTERMINPFYTDRSVNYDLSRYGTDADRRAFNHINRLDVSAIIGVSYEHGPLVLSLYVDHGFLPVSKESDPLRIIDNSQTTAANRISDEISAGNNSAYMLSLSYRLGTFAK